MIPSSLILQNYNLVGSFIDIFNNNTILLNEFIDAYFNGLVKINISYNLTVYPLSVYIACPCKLSENELRVMKNFIIMTEKLSFTLGLPLQNLIDIIILIVWIIMNQKFDKFEEIASKSREVESLFHLKYICMFPKKRSTQLLHYSDNRIKTFTTIGTDYIERIDNFGQFVLGLKSPNSKYRLTDIISGLELLQD